jgi:transposase-like protein
MADGRPLPLRPVGSVEIGPGVHLLETDEGGAVFLDGMASWCYEPDDVIGRRLAAVQLSETKAARPGAIAAAFGIEYETLRRWRMAWRESGVEGLVPQKTGMKGPYKLIEDKRREIAELHAQGLGLRAMQGLSASTPRRCAGDFLVLVRRPLLHRSPRTSSPSRAQKRATPSGRSRVPGCSSVQSQ